MENKNKSYADPSSIGQFGLALVTLVAGASKMHWISDVGLVIPWAIFLGGIAQLMAGIIDFKKNNGFGGTVFTAYGLFWLGMALSWMLSGGAYNLSYDFHGLAYGFVFLGYFIFTAFMTIGSTVTYKALFIIFVLIDMLFLSLTLNSFGLHAFSKVAAISELSLSAVAFYSMAGNLINPMLGYELLPLGKGFNWFKK